MRMNVIWPRKHFPSNPFNFPRASISFIYGSPTICSGILSAKANVKNMDAADARDRRVWFARFSPTVLTPKVYRTATIYWTFSLVIGATVFPILPEKLYEIKLIHAFSPSKLLTVLIGIFTTVSGFAGFVHYCVLSLMNFVLYQGAFSW